MTAARPQRRFTAHAAPSADAVGLAPDHPAARDARTLFPRSVHAAGAVPRVLNRGSNQRKLGDRVVKGAWAGMPIYALTLEERATCPRSCHHWASCYGNGMPLASRIAAGPELEHWLDRELEQLQRQHPLGFVVRLHILGDFYSVRYAERWGTWLRLYPALHVFGYTAWPADSAIGAAVDGLTGPRWRVRRSVPAGAAPGPGQAVTVPPGTSSLRGIVCPAQTGRTACCGTCGLCWAEAAWRHPIAFLQHGNHHPGPRPAGEARRDRFGVLLDMIAAAAAAGARSPTNKEIVARLSLGELNRGSLLVTEAERRGLIRVERFQRSRVITIVATGARTAEPASRVPHWRALRSAAA